MKQTYSGSCHCGAVQYQADLDLSKGTTRCNCTFCSKIRYWGTLIKPEDFRLVKGEGQLGDYSNDDAGHHRFCRSCGCHPYGDGNIPELGGAFVSINISCLDGMKQEDLAALPVQYVDGLHDNWWNVPAVTKHL